ncbi:MAG: hypothetical protein A3G44_15610 [Candidatus Rokubacteria bacterium RIFCSPLOWO2_12_FULL_73_47]|nr:MAG: hypothetical protein A3G44_15610 [Candidatus Rokubacteria bacterium RIFCSPLOWO2_12_FULL_73_47]
MASATITRRTPLAELPELLTIDEAAAWLRLGRNGAYELVRRGEIKSVRLGRLLRVPRAALEELAGGPQS